MNATPFNRGALSVDEFCAWASIGRAKFYREVSAGRLSVRKIGRKTVVLMTDAQEWLAALPVLGSAEAA
ncbi:helix-turn-helix domain-containing protein [Antarcticirhabdus aurantiaca]|uniref:Helix-turn-helix domain-containing protein n=1 Tax=Antarcticirhabdus aurantiaca TaxID=2606717 RepID=A0ACD4NKR3_9HYPH|nr:helix-turn-helix domain-containing protein [Antarcticirhabdus aurantiaca]WAJ27373.1 helix-turn-helix domain-containing protein [Jeongeuplla avenae]